MNSTYLPEPGVHEITPTSFLDVTENERFSLVTTKPDPKSGIRKRKKVGKECEKEKTEESSKGTYFSLNSTFTACNTLCFSWRNEVNFTVPLAA